jgi:hypothetical protein
MLPTKKIVVTDQPIGGDVDVKDVCTPSGLAWTGHKLVSNEGATTQSPVLQIKGGDVVCAYSPSSPDARYFSMGAVDTIYVRPHAEKNIEKYFDEMGNLIVEDYSVLKAEWVQGLITSIEKMGKFDGNYPVFPISKDVNFICIYETEKTWWETPEGTWCKRGKAYLRIEGVCGELLRKLGEVPFSRHYNPSEVVEFLQAFKPRSPRKGV